MPIQKMTEVPYPGVVPWLAVRKKINEIIEQGVGPSVTVDDALSSESENPVQNKVITDALTGKANITVSGTQPADAAEGDFWYDSTNDALYQYNGTSWNAVGGASGDSVDYAVITSINGIYNVTYKGVAYDDGRALAEAMANDGLSDNEPVPIVWGDSQNLVGVLQYSTWYSDVSYKAVTIWMIGNLSSNVQTAWFMTNGSTDQEGRYQIYLSQNEPITVGLVTRIERFSGTLGPGYSSLVSPDKCSAIVMVDSTIKQMISDGDIVLDTSLWGLEIKMPNAVTFTDTHVMSILYWRNYENDSQITILESE